MTTPISFFNHFLKGKGDKNSGLPEAYVYDTGKKAWKSYETWPPVGAIKVAMYLSDNQKLTTSEEKEKNSC